MAGKVTGTTNKNGTLPDVYLVCEGATDEALLAALTQKILRTNHAGISVAILAAQGKQQIPGLIQALDDDTRGESRLGIVVDSDGQAEQTKAFLRRNLDLEKYFVVIADPSVDAWFGEGVKRLVKDPKQIQRAVEQLDLDVMERRHPEIIVLRENLTQKPIAVVASQSRTASDLRDSRS